MNKYPKNYRGALAIDAPTLEIDAQGKPVLLEFFSLARVGYTPMRPSYFTDHLTWVEFYSGGVSATCGQVSADENSVVIQFFMRIKLGYLGRVRTISTCTLPLVDLALTVPATSPTSTLPLTELAVTLPAA